MRATVLHTGPESMMEISDRSREQPDAYTHFRHLLERIRCLELRNLCQSWQTWAKILWWWICMQEVVTELLGPFDPQIIMLTMYSDLVSIQALPCKFSGRKIPSQKHLYFWKQNKTNKWNTKSKPETFSRLAWFGDFCAINTTGQPCGQLHGQRGFPTKNNMNSTSPWCLLDAVCLSF